MSCAWPTRWRQRTGVSSRLNWRPSWSSNCYPRALSIKVIIPIDPRKVTEARGAPRPGTRLPVVHDDLLREDRRQAEQEVPGQRVDERFIHAAQLGQLGI